MWLGLCPARAWRRQVTVLASAGIVVAGVAVGDAQAQRRRATLDVGVRVETSCLAWVSAGTGEVDLDPVCRASTRAATLVEDGAPGTVVDEALPAATAPSESAVVATAAGEDGVRYLTVIY